ncbi:MAG: PAS domain S-box protein, partial [Anaerolineales bacterium]
MNQGTKVKETQNPAGNPSEELYRILFEQSAVGIFISDADGRFIEINPRGCEMLGYTKSELLKHAMHDIVQPHEHKIDFPEPIALQNGKVTVDEKMMLRKDGSLFPAKIGFQKLSNGNLLQSIHDLSEQKIKDGEILQLSRFPSENPNPVLRVSREGKILYANEASAKLLEEWNTGVGGMLPSAWKKTTSRLAEKRSDQNVEVPFRGRVYSMTITPVPGTDYVNLYGSDITEIKRSESALRQAEEKYRNIFEHSQDGIFQSTPSGKFITVNTALARIWGYDSPEDVIESITNIAHQVYVNPEQRQEFLRVMDENEEVVDFEFQAYRKDGGVIWVQENVRTVRDADGKVQYYEGTVKDITEQKQMVAALRHSEERYRSTLNNMMEGCQIIDYDWRYIYVNDTAALHGRYKPEEMLMRTMMELYPGIEKTVMFATLQLCMENRIPERMENEFTFPDGEKGWFELSIQPVPEGLFVLSLDISERKQAEIDLRDREARYRTLFENLPIPVFTKDIEGRYTTFNAEEGKYWAESPIGHTDQELLPSDIADDLRAVDLQVMETGKPWSGEELFQSSAGFHHSLSRKVPLHDGNGNVIGILGASVDITKRKQVESDLRESEERFRSLYENAAIGIYRTTPDGQILMVNPAAISMLGYENFDEMSQRNLEKDGFEATYPRSEFRERMEKEGVITGLEKAWVRKDGSTIYVRESARAIRDEDGNIKYYDGTFEDITEQKLTQEELRASEERYRDLINNSQEFICTHNLDGNILSVNPWAEKILGYKQGELLKMNIADFLLQENQLDFKTYLDEVQKNGRAKGLMVVRTHTGERLIWEYNNSLRTEGVEQPIVRGMAHDVTQQ